MTATKDLKEKLDHAEMMSSILSGGMEYLSISFDNAVKADDPITADMIYILNDFAKRAALELSEVTPLLV